MSGRAVPGGRTTLDSGAVTVFGAASGLPAHVPVDRAERLGG